MLKLQGQKNGCFIWYEKQKSTETKLKIKWIATQLRGSNIFQQSLASVWQH